MSLPQNVGQSDKNIRYLVAVIALVVAFSTYGLTATIALFVAIAAAATAYFGYCGLYQLLGISTCPMKKVSTTKVKKIVKKAVKKTSKKKAK